MAFYVHIEMNVKVTRYLDVRPRKTYSGIDRCIHENQKLAFFY
jgi:hypothetical protein